ncbi:hypothetical protein [Jannaschia rubra]|uniref:hypothetical protein n=1 Tax=Jannaschia rubra TaxID=282197 RepID=UPI000A5A905F|nr:hypothetical protein [Jannaschia rubra]
MKLWISASSGDELENGQHDDDDTDDIENTVQRGLLDVASDLRSAGLLWAVNAS